MTTTVGYVRTTKDSDEKNMKALLDSEGIRVIKKSDSMLMRFIGFFSNRFMCDYWTTFRVPFGAPTIAHPDDIKHPYSYTDVLCHEVIHCGQFRPWWGPFYVLFMVTLFPLPVLFSGRWIIERRAYLRDINAKCMTIQQAAETLWGGYLWPWPKPWMESWFSKQLKKQRTTT